MLVTAHIHVVFPKLTRMPVDPQVRDRKVGVKRTDEESAHALARRVTSTPDYCVLEVRRFSELGRWRRSIVHPLAQRLQTLPVVCR